MGQTFHWELRLSCPTHLELLLFIFHRVSRKSAYLRQRSTEQSPCSRSADSQDQSVFRIRNLIRITFINYLTINYLNYLHQSCLTQKLSKCRIFTETRLQVFTSSCFSRHEVVKIIRSKVPAVVVFFMRFN